MRFLSLLALVALIGHAAAADQTTMNSTCPVSGKPVDPTVKTVPFNPKTDTAAKANPGSRDAVGFCCPKCEATYDNDPEKYRAELEKQKSAKK